MFLILAAVLPAAYLMIKVYRSDRLEREPAWLVISLVLLGMISTALAGTAEQLGDRILSYFFTEESTAYKALFFFLIVGPAEEGFKYAVLRWRTWRHPAFDCQYDGVVYAVFVSLGFALWENIGYVLMYGMQTAVARALPAVPGHACFGVFMGVWYGMAKRREGAGDAAGSKRMRVRALLIPALLHGFYDFVASRESAAGSLVFIVFVILMFVTAYRLVRHVSDNDSYIQSYRFGFWG